MFIILYKWVINIIKFDRLFIDNDYKITISRGMIHIINYVSIEDFSSERVSIKSSNGITTIIGSNLVISKMEEDEIIIIGNFNSIQV